jgi:hypothetical protein
MQTFVDVAQGFRGGVRVDRDRSLGAAAFRALAVQVTIN